MSKIKNAKNLAIAVVVVALSSTAVAVAAESAPTTGTSEAAGATANPPKAERAHHRVPALPSTKVAQKAKQELLGQLEAAAKGVDAQDAAPSGPVAGVSQATLDAIAACESGGDPTAVNAAGYYGKYQFDTGTWASVGGTGNPAEASEGEQDYRASLLYQRAGASPWPVCGQ